MITLAIDEQNKHVLRVTASYLLALAGDLDVQITGADTLVKIERTDRVGEISITHAGSGPDVKTASAAFNASELAESAALPAAIPTGEQLDAMTAAAVFGGQVPQPPAGVPSIVDAGALPTVPVVMPATTSTAPLPVPVPPAPTPASVAPPAAPTTGSPAPGVELDTRGLPWDARIHARTKSKTANGQWKNARGIDAAEVTRIEAELRNLMAIPAAAPAVPVPPPLVPAAPAIAPPSVPAPPAPPASGATAASPSSFPELMLRISGAQTQRQLNQTQVSAVVAKYALPGIAALTQRPDLIPSFAADIEAQIAANVAAGVPV